MKDSLLAAYNCQLTGNLDEAIRIYRDVLRANPRDFEALYLFSLAQFEAGRLDEAQHLAGEAARINPGFADAFFARGCAFKKLGRPLEAIECFDQALAIVPGHPGAANNRAVTFMALRRFEEALAAFDGIPSASTSPDMAGYNRATALLGLMRFEEALATADVGLQFSPYHPDLLFSRGAALAGLSRHEEAIGAFDRALVLRPDFPDALEHRGIELSTLRRYEEAIASIDQALQLRPNSAPTIYNRGCVLASLRRYDDAAADYAKALTLEPDRIYLRGQLLECRLYCCDWRSFEQEKTALAGDLRSGRNVLMPMTNINLSGSQEDQLLCARLWTQSEFPAVAPIWHGERYEHDKIRIAYLAAELDFNAVAFQMAGVFEHHDKSRFETFLVSFGNDGQSAMRSRVESAFDRVIDIRSLRDMDAARLIRENEIDISVDLAGLTGNSRTGIQARRPAPVQVNYLGFPGTMGADCMDYILADRLVIPEDDRVYYHEKVAYLPDTLMPADDKQAIADRPSSRAREGLPESGFVFCCFNNGFKYNPLVFAIWMRLLHAVEGSVLWLPHLNDAAKSNLRREAQTRGVAPARLVFADFRDRREEHLARLRLADLFLDTLPYNAHASACDALWAGLPVLTCKGTSLAGRVGASVLTALGMPELIAQSLDAYEALALRLARDAQALDAVNKKLARNRETHPLFDTARFTRNLEVAYTAMWQRHRDDLPPAPIG